MQKESRILLNKYNTKQFVVWKTLGFYWWRFFASFFSSFCIFTLLSVAAFAYSLAAVQCSVQAVFCRVYNVQLRSMLWHGSPKWVVFSGHLIGVPLMVTEAPKRSNLIWTEALKRSNWIRSDSSNIDRSIRIQRTETPKRSTQRPLKGPLWGP